ncbi:MAG: CoA transferase, partial [Halieaceae bacterium]|nr:CoA transferase [Halieaceae bacterium]
IFVGVVSDSLWQRFCAEFHFIEWAADPQLKSNNQRVLHRDSLIPTIQALFDTLNKDQLMQRLDNAGIPFAPINKPIDLTDDPHMNAGGLLSITLSNGEKIKLPALPIEFDGEKPDLQRDLPAPGAGAREYLEKLGLQKDQITQLIADGVMIAD